MFRRHLLILLVASLGLARAVAAAEPPAPARELVVCGRDEVTMNKRSWLFDRDARAIFLHPHLEKKSFSKSITQHPMTGQTAFTEAERPNRWTTRIQFLHPDDAVSVPGEEFYKVRWNVPEK